MNLVKLIITNFRSVRAAQEFVFPEQPGLYFMAGVNEVEPRLGANAAGKSTVWDALFWCLYDRTPAGLRAGDVNNWGAGKGTEVSLIIEDDGIEYTVTRRWGPISWKLRARDLIGDKGDFDDEFDVDGKDPGNAVATLIRLGPDTFLQSVLMSQDGDMFLDLSGTDQAELFSRVMGLDAWLTRSRAASEAAAHQDGISRRLESEQAELRGMLTAAENEDFAGQADDWEAGRKRRLSALADEYEAAIDKNRELKAARDETAEEETNRRAIYQLTKDAAEGPRKDTGRAIADRSDYASMLAADQRRLEEVEAKLEELKETSTCPTCGLHVRKSEMFEASRKLSAEAAKLTRTVQATQKAAAGANTRAQALESAQERLDKAEQDARWDLDDAIDRAAAARRDLQFSESRLDDMERTAERLGKEVNPFADMVSRSADRVKSLRVSLAAIREDLDASEDRRSRLAYWVTGFKEIRLREISEALNELEIEVNSCCTALGLVDWELRFQVDRETKGGSLKRGFSVLVKSPHNRQAVPWAAWSGGEKQRLRLAGQMGLADLIRSRTGAGFPLEVWDEPTNALTPGGVDDLLESLAARARAEGRQIWLVDHRTHNFGGFAGGAVVTKTAAGSQISRT